MLENQDEMAFRNLITSNVPDDILSQAIDWIGENLSPADVFDEEQLNEWAKEAGLDTGE